MCVCVYARVYAPSGWVCIPLPVCLSVRTRLSSCISHQTGGQAAHVAQQSTDLRQFGAPLALVALGSCPARAPLTSSGPAPKGMLIPAHLPATHKTPRELLASPPGCNQRRKSQRHGRVESANQPELQQLATWAEGPIWRPAGAGPKRRGEAWAVGRRGGA